MLFKQNIANVHNGFLNHIYTYSHVLRSELCEIFFEMENPVVKNVV